MREKKGVSVVWYSDSRDRQKNDAKALDLRVGSKLYTLFEEVKDA